MKTHRVTSSLITSGYVISELYAMKLCKRGHEKKSVHYVFHVGVFSCSAGMELPEGCGRD
jgi:hypothetical protein